MCGPYYNADGIQGFISDGFTTLPLTPIGNHSFNCVDWDLEESSWITKILISYNTKRVKKIKLTTENNLSFERGQQDDSDFVSEVYFDQFDKLAGFVGYER